MRWPLILSLLALPATAGADPGQMVLDLTYSGYSHSFHAVTLQSTLVLTPTGYRISISGQTVGVVGFFFHAHWQSWADGTWAGRGIRSLHFENTGVFGGQPRHVSLAFQHGDAEVLSLQPVSDGKHTPVPPSFEQDVIDSLSLTALVIHQVATLGHCDARVHVFDGRQVEAMTLQPDGTEVLPPTSRSFWRGPTLRCQIDARVVAGFYGTAESDPLRTHTDMIWMANVLPGVPPLPVRTITETHQIRHLMLYLTGVRVRGATTPAAIVPCAARTC